jgi:hypothetical protein
VELLMAGIALQSATGNDIPNDQAASLDDPEFRRFLKNFEKRWASSGCVLRPNLVLRYNCHGLTFASRRTWIDDASLVPAILAQDGYAEVPVDKVVAGDIVVYYDDDGRADHSGIVMEGPCDASLGIPRILGEPVPVFNG